MKRIRPFFLRPAAALVILLICLCLTSAPLLAQSDGLTLRLTRDWGYGGFGGDIQGTFSFRAEGPDNLTVVDFYIDETVVGTDTESPWRYQFQTDDYPLGVHELYATGITADGTELKSNLIVRQFVSASQGGETVVRIIAPILGLVLLISVAGFLLDRRRGKTRRGYGMSGGAVCPKCGYPYGRHWWAPNLGAVKYDRCPNCSKWSRVGRATSQELAAAEAIHFANETPTPAEAPLTAAEELRKRLEESKYDEA